MQLARLVAALFLLAPADAASKPKAAILLSQVQSLTLRGHGAQTTHRRVPSAPQLKCLSHPSLCALVEPHLDVMRCQNMGSSYDEANVEWSCTATLPDEVRLGSTDVICEGYASSDDEYVLKGSCGVEYRVALTDAGEKRYPDLQRGITGPTNMFGYLFCLIFVGIVCWMIYKAWTNTNPRMANRIRRRHGRAGGRLGGGGGGWGGDDDYGPGGGGGGFGADTDSDAPPPYPGSSSRKSAPSDRQQQREGWRPGFWTGLAAGGAAAYAARGSSSRNNNDNNNRRQGGGFFGGGGSSSSYASSSRSGPSGSTHESTGFGSTSRR